MWTEYDLTFMWKNKFANIDSKQVIFLIKKNQLATYYILSLQIVRITVEG